jgi:hypothetical protein
VLALDYSRSLAGGLPGALAGGTGLGEQWWRAVKGAALGAEMGEFWVSRGRGGEVEGVLRARGHVLLGSLAACESVESFRIRCFHNALSNNSKI